MAVLGDSERFEVWAQIMRELPMPGVTKPELRAAVNALDTWLNDNAAAANAALPQPARGALTRLTTCARCWSSGRKPCCGGMSICSA